MSIQKPSKIENFDQLNTFIQDFFNNYGMDDLRPSGIRTEAPTAEKLDKGRQVVAEVSGVPTIYIRGLDGNLYKLTATLA